MSSYALVKKQMALTVHLVSLDFAQLVFESATETVTETIESDATGTTTTTTTTTETTETTVTVPETGNLLTDQKVQEMGRNQKFGGDMTKDWGAQGSGGIRNGANLW